MVFYVVAINSIHIQSYLAMPETFGTAFVCDFTVGSWWVCEFTCRPLRELVIQVSSRPRCLLFANVISSVRFMHDSFHQYTPSCSDVASGLTGPVVTELSQLIHRLSVAISLSAIERNDVTKSTATIRSPFCGYCYDTALFSVTPLFESVQHYSLPPTSIRTCSHMTS